MAPRYMPKHSKVPVGARVATTYGICILVGWRVEDDVMRQRIAINDEVSGVAYAYLNRNAIHSTHGSSRCFRVQTKFDGVTSSRIETEGERSSLVVLLPLMKGIQWNVIEPQPERCTFATERSLFP
jgi:hypothetical protein